MVKPAFECRGASVKVGGKTLLSPCNLSIAPGELVIIVGPNGAGKSTLLKLLAGDHSATSGAVFYDGCVLDKWDPSRLAARRAVMAQSTRMAFPFTVFEIVRLGARLQISNKSGMQERISEALQAVDLLGYEGRFYAELSGGEQQRVQLARTLCQVWEPVRHGISRFLFLDEPTASLDIKHQIDILTLARRYVDAGGGCIAVLHDLNIAAMFADRLIALKQASIVADGPPKDVLTDDFMREVFDVPIRVSAVPPANQTPYLLPQTATG